MIFYIKKFIYRLTINYSLFSFLGMLLVLPLFLTFSCQNQSSKKTNSKFQNTENSKNSQYSESSQEDKNLFQKKLNEEITIVFLGDSLTEGYGIDKNDSYPTQTEIKLNKKIKKGNANLNSNKKAMPVVKSINGGLSGDTTIGGLNRVEWFLKQKPNFLFIALGSNDGLRGLNPETTKKNLTKIIEMAKKTDTQLILSGMELPLNYGEKYRSQFRNIYLNLAKEYQLEFLPFLLKNVAGEEDLNLDDGIHPNEKGHALISDRVSDFIYQILLRKGKI